jgi:DnaJ-class molecular chaperone
VSQWWVYDECVTCNGKGGRIDFGVTSICDICHGNGVAPVSGPHNEPPTTEAN